MSDKAFDNILGRCGPMCAAQIQSVKELCANMHVARERVLRATFLSKTTQIKTHTMALRLP